MQRFQGIWGYATTLLALERRRLVLWIPVLFGMGIGLYFSLVQEPAPWAALPSTVVCLFATFACQQRPIVKILSVSALVVTGGFAVAQWHTLSMDTPRLDTRIGPVQVSGIVETVLPGVGTEKIILSAPSWRNSPPMIRIRLSVKDQTPNIVPGNLIRVRAVLKPPPAPLLPGSYDFQRRAFFDGIGAYGFVLGKIEVLETQAHGFKAWMTTKRLLITRRIISFEHGTSGAVAAALLTGHRGYIPEETMQNMRDAGLAHLLAISGLHIGLAAGLIFAAVRTAVSVLILIGIKANAKKIAAVMATFGAGGYALLAGWTVPTERAFLMTTLVLLGFVIDRRTLSLRTVAWAAMVVLITMPHSLLAPGFQMSFAAVTALIGGYEILQRRMGKRDTGPITRILRYVAGVLLTSLIAGTATASFAIYHFQHVATFGLIANALAVPLAAVVVMPAGLATLAASIFELEDWPLAIMTTGIDAILWVAGTVADMPMAAMDVSKQSVIALVVLTCGGLWLILWNRNWRYLGLVAIVLGCVDPFRPPRPDIIVEGRARLVTIVTDDALISTTNRKAKFEVSAWRRQFGLDAAHVIVAKIGNDYDFINCDAQGCIVRRHGRFAAISLDVSTISEDCLYADIIVALEPLRDPCTGSIETVGRFDLWKGGTHTVSIRPDRTIIRSVNGVRGWRPWVIRPTKRIRNRWKGPPPNMRGKAPSAHLGP